MFRGMSEGVGQGYSSIMSKGSVRQVPIYAEVRINILHAALKTKPPIRVLHSDPI